MHAYFAARCGLCGAEELAVELVATSDLRSIYPGYALGNVLNGRHFVSGQYALLHHECRSPQADTDTHWWTPESSWWACRDPERPLDADAHFDLNCNECAVRWAAENR